MYIGYTWTFNAQNNLRSFAAFPTFPIFRNRRRAKGSNLGLGVLSAYGVLLTVKCTRSVWGHSVHFRLFNKLVARNRMVEQNGHKFGPRRYLLSVYGVFLTVKCSRSVWGHSVHFRFSTTLFPPKGWPWSETDYSLCLECIYLVYPWYCWFLRVQGHAEVIRCISNFRQPCISKTDANLWLGGDYSLHIR